MNIDIKRNKEKLLITINNEYTYSTKLEIFNKYDIDKAKNIAIKHYNEYLLNKSINLNENDFIDTMLNEVKK